MRSGRTRELLTGLLQSPVEFRIWNSEDRRDLEPASGGCYFKVLRMKQVRRTAMMLGQRELLLNSGSWILNS